MDITLIMKIVGIGFLVSASYIILNKTGRDEMAMLVSIAGIIVVLVMMLSQLSGLLDEVRSLFGI
ncbi:MAG: stage III sporulation protein AC [Clostridia bacterium]|nr:stage III sporulation protein AC [Clostridia bacterium]